MCLPYKMPSKTVLVDIMTPTANGMSAPIRNDRKEKLGKGEPRQVDRIIDERGQRTSIKVDNHSLSFTCHPW